MSIQETHEIITKMSNMLAAERSVVIPGETLAQGMDFLPGDNTYRENEKIYSKVLGLTSASGRVIKVTALSGPYVPKVGDKIIVKVFDITMSGWRVQTGTAYPAMLNVRDATTRFVKKQEDLSEIIAIDDYLIVTITNVTSQNLIDVTMKEPGLKKIEGGRIISINCQKVPRVIGKKASMIGMIKDHTKCEITVGQNGFIWIKGTPEGEQKAKEVIKMIEAQSHLSGLTDKIKAHLEQGGAQ